MEAILLTRKVLRGEHPAVPFHRNSTGGSPIVSATYTPEQLQTTASPLIPGERKVAH